MQLFIIKEISHANCYPKRLVDRFMKRFLNKLLIPGLSLLKSSDNAFVLVCVLLRPNQPSSLAQDLQIITQILPMRRRSGSSSIRTTYRKLFPIQGLDS